MKRTVGTTTMLIGLGAVVLAGCGSSKSSSSSPGATPAATTGAAASGSASAGPSDTSSPSAASTSKAVDKTAVTGAGKSDGKLTVGDLLPQTGSLATLGPPEFAGVGLAIKEINAAGGVLGKPVTEIPGDSGDATTDIATQTVNRELAAGADVIVGAASSAVSLTVIDKITNSGVIEFSPANTSTKFTTYPDKGLYFRTAPSDLLQGGVVGNVVVGDGHSKVAILALQDPYGTGLADQAEKAITGSGGQVVSKIIYDPNAASYDDVVGQTKAKNPDSILLIGFDESKKVIQSLVSAGIGPSKVPLYGVDGNISNTLGDGLPPGTLNGVKGTTPLTKLSSDFQAKLKSVDPKLRDFNYAGESYDAVTITALATEIAKTDLPTAVAKQISGVTKVGTPCMSFATCDKLVKAGTDIAYVGVAGALKLDDAGDPTSASYGVLTIGPDNKIVDSKTTYVTAGAQ